MKRILLSVFAAAITAAWVVPASAADVTFGGEYRLRGEYTNNKDFNENTNDNSDFWGQRIRLTANAKATDDTTVKITLQDTRTWGRAANGSSTATAGGPNLTDSVHDFVDLHEGFVNVDNLFGAPLSLKAGRQELNYGDQRLVGSFGWSNNGRSFDALKLTYKSEQVDVDLFTSKINETLVTNRDQDFLGIYATVKAIPNNTLDVYVLNLRDGNQTTGSLGSGPFGWGSRLGNTTVVGNELKKTQTLYTYGVRLKGAVEALDYTLEVPMQRGNVETSNTKYKINAYAAAIKAGYTLPTPMKVRVGVEYDYASGDKEPGGNGTATATSTSSAGAPNETVKTFFNLFPTNHGHLGIADQQGWRNVKAWNINAKADVNEKLSISAAYWNFKLAQKLDNWYGAGDWNTTGSLSALRTTVTTNTKSDIGSEIDLVANYKYNNAVSAQLGVARFNAGSYVKDQLTATATPAGSSKDGDMSFAYLMLTANF